MAKEGKATIKKTDAAVVIAPSRLVTIIRR
jgi:hypothetical protein